MLTLIKTKDGGYLGTASASVLAVKTEEDSQDIVLFVSSEAVDGDGDILHQRKSKFGPGWQLERFNKAPVITWQHDMRVPNLSGPRTRAKVGKHPTKGVGLFLDPLQMDEGDAFAMVLDGKIRRDVITESSVGFLITHHEPLLVEGVRKGIHIYGADLREVALANRGTNPDTEAMAKALLGDPVVLNQVAYDSKAFDTLRAKVEALTDQLHDSEQTLAMLAEVVKTFGDPAGGEVRSRQAVETIKAARNDAAADVLEILRAAGAIETSD